MTAATSPTTTTAPTAPAPAGAPGEETLTGRAPGVVGELDLAGLRERLAAAGLDPAAVERLVAATIDEDLSWGPDVTTESIFPGDRPGRAVVASRQEGCLAGVEIGAIAQHLMAQRLGATARTRVLLPDGTRLRPGDRVLEIEAPLRCLLTAERTMLNLMGQLSGVATATARWADALAGTGTRVRDTRKTVPGLRALQKYAVRCGGGTNHRMGLGDAALIKDNHIAAAGSITAALGAVRRAAPGIACEVECDTLDQVREAIAAGCRLVLLDNMAPRTTAEAVALCRPAGVETEASGGLSIEDLPARAGLGLTYISVGALTHSAPVLDLGLDELPLEA